LRVLTQAEVRKWFDSFPEGIDSLRRDSFELFFTAPDANCFDIQYPRELERLRFVARCLATLGYEVIDFRGAMLWIIAWGVGQEVEEGPGYRIFEAMNLAVGQPMSIEVTAGHKFRADELDAAVASLLQPMIFGWDAIYYPSWSYGADQFFLHINNNSFITVVTRTKEFHDKVFAQLDKLNLIPKPSPELRRSRFCRPI
jgi:hypothetical protein